MFWVLQGERPTPAAEQGVTGAADFYYSTLTQFRSCHSNIAVYAPSISITATATAAATNAFIRILPAENRCCCSSGYALQHDDAFSAAALQR
jgi:hypothetical protein